MFDISEWLVYLILKLLWILAFCSWLNGECLLDGFLADGSLIRVFFDSLLTFKPNLRIGLGFLLLFLDF